MWRFALKWNVQNSVPNPKRNLCGCCRTQYQTLNHFDKYILTFHYCISAGKSHFASKKLPIDDSSFSLKQAKWILLTHKLAKTTRRRGRIKQAQLYINCCCHVSTATYQPEALVINTPFLSLPLPLGCCLNTLSR